MKTTIYLTKQRINFFNKIFLNYFLNDHKTNVFAFQKLHSHQKKIQIKTFEIIVHFIIFSIVINCANVDSII